MRFKKFILTLLVLLTAVAAQAGPKQKNALSHIKFGKYRVVSLVPTSLRSVRAGVEIETKNDTSAFRLQDVKLTIYRKGEPFLEGVCEEVNVPKGTSTVHVNGEFELCEEVSLWSAVTSIRNTDYAEFTGNVDLTVVSEKGRKVAYSQKDISLGSFGGRKAGKKADESVTSANSAAQSSAQPAEKSTASKPSQPKQSTQPKKRPWWQFWKK